MEGDTLYEKGRLKITYLHSPEPGREKEVISGEDHELWIKDKNNEWNRYIIQRGILRELAGAAENDSSRLVGILNRTIPDIFSGMRRWKIRLGEIGTAFIEAYQKEQEEFEKYLAK